MCCIVAFYRSYLILIYFRDQAQYVEFDWIFGDASQNPRGVLIIIIFTGSVNENEISINTNDPRGAELVHEMFLVKENSGF